MIDLELSLSKILDLVLGKYQYAKKSRISKTPTPNAIPVPIDDELQIAIIDCNDPDSSEKLADRRKKRLLENMANTLKNGGSALDCVSGSEAMEMEDCGYGLMCSSSISLRIVS